MLQAKMSGNCRVVMSNRRGWGVGSVSQPEGRCNLRKVPRGTQQNALPEESKQEVQTLRTSAPGVAKLRVCATSRLCVCACEASGAPPVWSGQASPARLAYHAQRRKTVQSPCAMTLQCHIPKRLARTNGCAHKGRHTSAEGGGGGGGCCISK